MKGVHLLAQFGPAWAAIAAASAWTLGIMCSLRFRSDSGLRGKGAVGHRDVFSTVQQQYLHTVST